MSQIQKLRDYIKDKGQISFDEAEIKARAINPSWRTDTWTCGLRHSNNIQRIYKYPNLLPSNPKNVVTGYKYVKPTSEIIKEVEKEEKDLEEVIKDLDKQNNLQPKLI